MVFFYRYNKILVVLVSVLLFISCNTTKHVPDNQYLLKSNHIKSDNENLKTKPIYNYLKQHENTKTAMFFYFHLWVYNISHEKEQKKKRIKKWLGIYKLENIVGEPPVVVDSMLNKVSVNQIHRYLRNKGYYYSEVKDSVAVFGRHKKKAEVYYLIKTGKPFLIQDIKYNIKDTSIYNLIIKDTTNSLIKAHTNFDSDIFQDERIRISKYLKNNGFYKFSKEYVYYQVDTSNYKANIEIKIINLNDTTKHHQYLLNNIYYFHDFEPQEFLKLKNKYYQYFDTAQYKADFFLSQKKTIVKPKIIYNSSYLRKGEFYSALKVQNTIQRLSSLNEFKLINIRYNEVPDSNAIDVLVQLTPFKKHNYITEIEGTNSSGNLGIGGRISYQHKSLFRGAEIFNVSLYGNIESQQTFSNSSDNIVFNSQEIGATVNLHLPQFILPFRTERFIKKNHPKTMLNFSMNYKDRPEYTRTIFGSSYGYYWSGEHFFKHHVNLIDISSVKVFSMDPQYYKSIQNTYLEKAFDDYLISATNYTVSFNNKKQQKGKSYFFSMFKGEIAGNLLNLYCTMRQSEPIDGSYYVFDNKFAQYWRAEIDLRYFLKLKKKRDFLVGRLYTGIAQPYGNITAMPYVKQFSTGGANGIRAWPVRGLGPGSYFDSNRKYYNEASDLKLEGNIEYRFKLIGILESALFIDAGNIWSSSSEDPRQGAQFNFDTFYKEIAIGSGVGLRLDLSFFIFRIDYGIKIRDPKEIESERWVVTNKKYNPFKSEYSMFNFGIDYPF